MSTTKQKNSALMTPVKVSKELEAVVGKGPMSRAEVTKNLWKYIKKNELQDSNNKRQICPDEKLSAVFGTTKSVDMFKMTGLVSKHLTA